MRLIKIDANMADHPRMLEVSDRAFREHIRALCMATNDGLLSFTDDWQFPDTTRLELIKAGVWTWTVDGWELFGWIGVTHKSEAQPRHPVRMAWDAMRTRINGLVYARDAHQCVFCGTDERLTVDHIIPISRGGTNEFGNLQTLCQPCNSRKGARV
jgi:hypothetical protein